MSNFLFYRFLEGSVSSTFSCTTYFFLRFYFLFERAHKRVGGQRENKLPNWEGSLMPDFILGLNSRTPGDQDLS